MLIEEIAYRHGSFGQPGQDLKNLQFSNLIKVDLFLCFHGKIMQKIDCSVGNKTLIKIKVSKRHLFQTPLLILLDYRSALTWISLEIFSVVLHLAVQNPTSH